MRPHLFQSFTVALLAAGIACSTASDGGVWTFRTARPWLAGDSEALTPAVDAQSAFFCGGYFWNSDAAIHALSLKDGRVLWKQRVGDCRSDPWLIASTLVVHSRESRNGPCVFQGFDPGTGRVRWRHEFPTDGPLSTSSCTIHEAMIGESILFADDRNVSLLHAADGTVERFTFPLGRSRDQRIWLTASGSDGWFGFGTHVWRWTAGRPQPEEASGLSRDAESPDYAAADGARLFLGYRKPGRLRAFDLTTGQVRWEKEMSPQILSMSAGGERLYLNVWRQRYELIAADLQTGNELWTAGIGGFYPPLKKDRWLYGNGESSVFVADPATGQIARTLETKVEVTTTPVPAGDLLLYGTIDGALHAVRVDGLKRSVDVPRK